MEEDKINKVIRFIQKDQTAIHDFNLDKHRLKQNASISLKDLYELIYFVENPDEVTSKNVSGLFMFNTFVYIKFNIANNIREELGKKKIKHEDRWKTNIIKSIKNKLLLPAMVPSEANSRMFPKKNVLGFLKVYFTQFHKNNHTVRILIDRSKADLKERILLPKKKSRFLTKMKKTLENILPEIVEVLTKTQSADKFNSDVIEENKKILLELYNQTIKVTKKPPQPVFMFKLVEEYQKQDKCRHEFRKWNLNQPNLTKHLKKMDLSLDSSKKPFIPRKENGKIAEIINSIQL